MPRNVRFYNEHISIAYTHLFEFSVAGKGNFQGSLQDTQKCDLLYTGFKPSSPGKKIRCRTHKHVTCYTPVLSLAPLERIFVARRTNM